MASRYCATCVLIGILISPQLVAARRNGGMMMMRETMRGGELIKRDANEAD